MGVAMIDNRRNYSNLEVMSRSNCLLAFCIVAGLVVFAIGLGVAMVNSWHMESVALYVFILCVVTLFVCLCVVGWQLRGLFIDHSKSVYEVKLLSQQSDMQARALQLADAVGEDDGFKLRVSDKELMLEVLRRAEHAKQQGARIVDSVPGQSLMVIDDTPDPEDHIPLPVAPSFWDAIALVTSEHMPLCFVVDEDSRSATYLQTIPVFGTILDLLSLSVTGKPGRGKSVLLLYYLCILCAYGSEVHILDPQGAFKELELLHGKPLPAMPPTARIYYYSDPDEMETAVSVILGEVGVRGKLYKPHMENGVFKRKTLKHPLVIMADELPIIAEIDLENKARVREENKIRKEEGKEALEVRQVVRMIKTAVMAARKYYVYFIGASQSIDATILPTRVSAAFNSRIVFFNEKRKALMTGLEKDVAERFLPALRRAGPGVSIYDCSRWSLARVAAFPDVTIEDVLLFFGVSMEELEALWIAELQAQEQQQSPGPITGPLKKEPQVMPNPVVAKRATLQDAIQIWNEQPGIGRPQLRKELLARGFECTDYLSDQLLQAIQRQIDVTNNNNNSLEGENS
jgi:hypothetical protein